ncbi:ABC transporter permease [Paenibacillus hodogayensis]|uniref:ABC transporter permease n=1 Tax=Paenibacillus hodogayensis TaxID=279208 RepID=A0ABV5VX61_9BACL
MRFRDYIALGWDQLRRRKVVTLLCVMGIAIGSASIVVALAFGESISHYSTKQMSYYLKTDEITIMNQNGGSADGSNGELNEFGLTKQKLNMIKELPHVKSAASFADVGSMPFIVDDTKTGMVSIVATELSTLPDFGHEFQQGVPIDQDNVIVLSYTATVGLRDWQTSLTDGGRRQQSQLEQDIIQGREKAPIVPYPLYRKQIRLQKTINLPDGTVKTLEFPVRVVAIGKREEGMSDRGVFFSQKQAYISPGLAQQIRDAEAAVTGKNQRTGNAENQFDTVQVKIDNAANVEKTDKLIQSLKLRTSNNLSRQESMSKEFAIVRIIFGGAGLFILFVASISIVVAMTMSTHQRRRQIGIMKVLGANLKQIRNMFVVESALLGVMGGLAGILFAYWVIWGINVILVQTNPAGSAEAEIMFISLWILPLGMFFAIMTGVMSGIFPAIKASRTDALTAIKRE